MKINELHAAAALAPSNYSAFAPIKSHDKNLIFSKCLLFLSFFSILKAGTDNVLFLPVETWPQPTMARQAPLCDILIEVSNHTWHALDKVYSSHSKSLPVDCSLM